MVYRPFKIPDLSSAPATLATAATVCRSPAPTVANVAGVAAGHVENRNCERGSSERARANVVRLLDAMAAENDRRRDWHTQPVDGWREDRLELRSAETGEATIIYFPNRSART